MAKPAVTRKDENDEIEHLLTRIIDSCEGYESAVKAAKESRFETMFEKRAGQRYRFVDEIRSCLAESGNDIEIHGSTLGEAHHIWVGLRSKLGGDDKGVFKEIVRGENLLVDAYESALEKIPASYKLYSVLTRQLSTVRADLQDARQKCGLAE